MEMTVCARWKSPFKVRTFYEETEQKVQEYNEAWLQIFVGKLLR